MIYCNNCELCFQDEEVKRIPNYVPYGLGEVLESEILECPHCSSDDLTFDENLDACECCGEIMPTDLLTSDDDGLLYCDKCIKIRNNGATK